MPCEIDFLGEGQSDEAIARRLIAAAGGIPGNSYFRPRRGSGKDSLDRRLKGLNAGARFGRPALVLRDLDNDAPCAGALVSTLLPKRHCALLLRVCVHQAEAWLVADTIAYARYAGVAVGRLPNCPEETHDLKRMVCGWAERGEARRLAAHFAEGYRRGLADWMILGEWHAVFAERVWDPERAANSDRAPSLSRSLHRLRAFVQRCG